MGLGMVREQARGLNRDQRNAFVAAWLGWAMDAFDYFLLVFVITDVADHTKKIIFHPKMMPGIVIEDPELTVGLPPQVTAATGMDALSHCLEAYCSPFYHPLAEGIAVEGMRLIKEWLPVATRDGR